MFWDKPDLLVLSGSHLYGYSTPESDEDYIGFVIPPMSLELDLFANFDQKTPTKEELESGNDKTVFSLRKFLHSISRNNTQCLEVLYAPEANIREKTEWGQLVIDHRHDFLSKSMYKRFAGYAYSEFRKVRGKAIVPVKQTRTEKDVINDIRNLFSPDKESMDKILDLLYKDREKVEVDIFRQLGEKRKASIRKYGYSVKNAAHCIRLLVEGVQLLEEETLTYPFDRETLDLLVNIRAGNVKYEEIEVLFNEWSERLKCAADKSTLPKKPNVKEINQLYLHICNEAY